MSPHFSFINVLLLSSQMEVTSKERIQPKDCAQHEPETLQRAHCRGLWLMWCPAHGSYQWADSFTDVLPPTPKEIQRHVDSMKPSYKGALVRQKPYNCARNEPDTVQQPTTRDEHIIWCHGHKVWEYSDTEKTGPPSKKEIGPKYKQLEETIPK